MTQDITLGGPKRPTHNILAVVKSWSEGVGPGVPIPVNGILPEDYLLSVQARVATTGAIVAVDIDDYFISANGGHVLTADDNSLNEVFIKWYDRHQESPVTLTHADPQLGRVSDWRPGTPVNDLTVGSAAGQVPLNSMLYAWWAPENQVFLGQSGTDNWDFGDVGLTQEEFDSIRRYAIWRARSALGNRDTVDGFGLRPINGTAAFNTLGNFPAVPVNGRAFPALAFGQGVGLNGPGVQAAIPDSFSEEWTFSIVLQNREGSGHIFQLENTFLILDPTPTTGEGLNTLVSSFTPGAKEPFVVTCIFQTDATSKLLVNNLAAVVGTTGTNTFTGPETLFVGCSDDTGADSSPLDIIEIVLSRPEQVFTGGVGPSTADQYGRNVHDYLMRKYRFRGITN